MPRLENAGGDVLARGGVRATFKPMGQKLTDEQWAGMFDEEKVPVVKAVYIFKCPEHGLFTSEREAFVSGGFPLLNEYAFGKCPLVSCQEKSGYAGYKEIGSDASNDGGNTSVGVGEAVASE